MAATPSIPGYTEVVYLQTWRFDEPRIVASDVFSNINLSLTALSISPTALPELIDIGTWSSGGTTAFYNGSISTTDSFLGAPVSSDEFTSTSSTSTKSTPLTDSSLAPSATTKAVASSSSTQTTSPQTNTSLNSTVPQTSESPATSKMTPSVSSSAGLSKGQAAGLAVGCLFAGAIIAIAVVCIFTRRYRRRSMILPKRKRTRVPDSDPDKPSSATILRHLEKQSASPSFDLLLAPPIPDSELLTMFKKLQELITSHVERYLADNTPSDTRNLDSSFNQRLSDLAGPACLLGPHNLAKMLLERQTQSITAKHLLAKSILSNIESSGPPETTLLPPELSECMASMAGLKSEAQGIFVLIVWTSILNTC